VDAERRRPSSVKKTVVEELSGAQHLQCQWLESVTARKVCVLDFLPEGGKIYSAALFNYCMNIFGVQLKPVVLSTAERSPALSNPQDYCLNLCASTITANM